MSHKHNSSIYKFKEAMWMWIGCQLLQTENKTKHLIVRKNNHISNETVCQILKRRQQISGWEEVLVLGRVRSGLISKWVCDEIKRCRLSTSINICELSRRDLKGFPDLIFNGLCCCYTIVWDLPDAHHHLFHPNVIVCVLTRFLFQFTDVSQAQLFYL